MRIAIVGAGGVGGYLAALLEGSADLAVVDVGPHLDAIRRDGLVVRSRARGELRTRPRATDNPAEIGSVDLVVYAVKTYDNDVAIPALRPLVGPQTTIVTVQNGIGNVERLAAAYGAAAIVGGPTVGGGTRVAPGVIEHVLPPEAEYIELGSLDPAARDRARAARDALAPSGLTLRLVDDIHRILWAKLLAMASLAAVGCLTRTPTAGWRDHPQARGLYARLVREAAAVARADGAALDDAAVEGVLAQPDRLGPGHRTSMAADLERGERLEVEAVQGEIVRRAARHGVPAPALETVYAVLRHADDRARATSHPAPA